MYHLVADASGPVAQNSTSLEDTAPAPCRCCGWEESRYGRKDGPKVWKRLISVIASIPKILGRNFVRIFFFFNWDSLCFLFQHIFNYCCDYLMSSINDSPKQWFPVTADAQQCILVTVVQTISGEKILSRQQPWINSSPYNILCVRS